MSTRVADRLIALRRHNNFSRQQLAERLGVGEETILGWESAQIAPEMADVLALSRLYGVTLDELLDPSVPLPITVQPEEGEAEFVEAEVVEADLGDKQAKKVQREERERRKNIDGLLWVAFCFFLALWLRPVLPSFPYPVFVTIFYMGMGIVDNLWHPGWLIYLTIPLYYAV